MSDITQVGNFITKQGTAATELSAGLGQESFVIEWGTWQLNTLRNYRHVVHLQCILSI